MKKILNIFIASLLLLQTACNAAVDTNIDKILAAEQPPVGVVFEVSSSDDDGFDWAAPLLKTYAMQLRKKFPELKLAVVAHGLEQFQLTREKRQQHAGTHSKVQSLVKDDDIDVHVCGNFASMLGVDKKEFVDFVKVAERAPLKIDAFRQAGYRLVILTPPNN